jgi:O-antigen/teichoic acid export membrane protein
MQITAIQKLTKSRLFKDSAIYTFGAFFQKGIAYFLIPLYMGVLLPSEYGELNIFTTLISISVILFSCGLNQVYFSEFYHYDENGKAYLIKMIINSYLVFAIPLSIFLFILFLIFGEFLLKFKPDIIIIILSFFIGFLTFFQSLYFATLRLSNKSLKFVIINVSTGILLLASNIYLVYYLRIGIKGIFVSNFIVMLITFIIARRDYYKLNGALKLKIDQALIKYLKLGFPFILASLFYWFANYANVWIINRMLDTYSVGIYTTAFRFAQIYDPLIIAPLLGAYTPYLFKRLKEKKYKTKLNIIVPGILLLFGILIFISLFIAKMSSKIASTENYDSSYVLIPYLVMSFAFTFIAQLAGGILVYYKKTAILTINILIAGLINVTLTIWFIHNYGLLGSAIASAISNGIWASLTLYQGRMQIIKTIKAD